MNKIKSGAYQAPENRKYTIYNIGFSNIKCFGDADCDESPSAGWHFVKYCMRG